MDIFESLENLNVSEECFDDIVSIVEEILSEEDDFEFFQNYMKKEREKDRKKLEKLKSEGKGDSEAARRIEKAFRNDAIRTLRRTFVDPSSTIKAGEEHQQAIDRTQQENK